MAQFKRNIPVVIVLCSILGWVWGSNPFPYAAPTPQKTATPPDTGLPYPFKNNTGNPYTDSGTGGIFLNNPSNLKSSIEYDPTTNQYLFNYKIGDLMYSPPTYMTLEEYLEWDLNRSLLEYWSERAKTQGSDQRQGTIPKLHIGGQVFDQIFGSNTIDIRPQGSAELIFGILANRIDNPQLDVRQQRTANFDFQEKIQMNVMAKIGDKIQFGVNYNTEANFDFENKMKLQYEGKEDEIIQLIEAGDVTLPLTGTLITGSQALFGIKTKLKFGRATVTSVFSQQKSQSSNITVSGGAQTSEFNIKADEYEENKHFFLSQYFRDNYNKGLEKLPVITSSVNITKLEVWVTNIGAATTENRNIIAFQDLGERDTIYRKNIIGPTWGFPAFPANQANTLMSLIDTNKIRDINTASSYLSSTALGFTSGIDFEKVENARKLNPGEYTFNPKLGFISLNSRLNSDQVLAVAYQYTIIGDTTVYQVGEFSNGGIAAPKCLVVKLLKSTALNTKIPLWKLMMKNVYSIGAYQVNSQDFRLNVLYEASENGIPMGFLTEGAIEGQPLIRALNLDRLNTQQDPYPDGVFDFIDGAATNGGTIQASNGRIFFPVVEPFGLDLRKAIDPANPYSALASKYAFDQLYKSTKNEAQQHPEKNRFYIAGIYKSASGSDISLNAMNVPQGSVKVTAGGVVLQENVDYTVDYTLGRVKIINEGYLNSGTPINISLESNSMFNFQTKRLMGTHIDYKVNNELNLGATILNLTERPLTQKVNYGDEPISNTIWGLDGIYQTESRLITKMVDKLPFINTKAPSRVTINGEFAHFIPGHARAIGKTGTSYIDDFEGSASGIDIKNIGMWYIASTPQGQSNLFPEAKLDSLAYGFNRAKISWYVVDPLFVRNNSATPSHIKNDLNEQSNHFAREVLETEVFPAKESPNGTPTTLAVLNLAFDPSQRGPYNYETWPTTWSRGLLADGKLKDPDTRWGGIMRKMETTDFEATNVEYIEFWMMDPFIYDPNHTGGELYFNLGDISEDVLKDGRKSYENGLPTSATVTNVDTTIWGRVPTLQAIVNAFDNNPATRPYQDVGLDGLGDDDEKSFFASYLNRLQSVVNASVYAQMAADPSNDNYHYFLGDDYDNAKLGIIDRYKLYNGMEGNSPTGNLGYTQNSPLPNVEDLNNDNTLSSEERYFQYHITLKPDKMNIGENYITDIYEANVRLKNGTTSKVKWYQFKIPIQSPEKVVGDIQDFKSIRFMRIFMRNFSQPIICRFATLELVRGEWRKYRYSLLSPGEYIPDDNQNLTSFTISAVNVEENGKRKPVPYVMPPGIERELNLGSTTLYRSNEQSLVLKVCHLLDGDARAAYKTADFDFRRYKKLKMFVHAEQTDPVNEPVKNGDLTVFVRLGSDFTSNYYEYEIPLTLTAWGTSALNQEQIWPESNAFDVNLEDLLEVKQERNVKMREAGSTITLSNPYTKYNGKNKITVVGMPNLAAVKTIMIGVRNPKKQSLTSNDDGMPKCAEIWVNEMRLTDFDDKSGWAATSRIAADLADLGQVTLAGSVSTPGFGSIEKKINERQTSNNYQYDFATDIELGKFLPEKSGVKIPMHFDYSEVISNPEFNPINPDVKFSEDLKTYSNLEQRDSVRKLSQDYTRRKSINFVNVRKNKTGAGTKSHIYDIENFDFTYTYSEMFHRNIDIEYDLKKKYKGAVGYNFVVNPKNVKPFGKVKLFNKYKSFALIKDFNFYYMPRLIAFRSDMDREYNENLFRNKTKALVILEPTYVKNFTWDRQFDLSYDLTQGMKFTLKTVTNARIDEPPGVIDKNDPSYKNKRDSILHNIKDFGRITTYNQQFGGTYTVPINKIPMFNWLSVTAQYSSIYQWTAAPLAASYLGNVIENSNTRQLNGNANLTTLYNKIPYIKKISTAKQPLTAQSKGLRPAALVGEETPEPKKDSAKKVDYFKIILDNTLRIITGVKNVSLSYSESNGIVLPGFKPSPVFLGVDWNLMAPGPGFVFGEQKDIRQEAVEKGWLTTSPELNQPYLTKQTKNLNFRSTIEPLPDIKIDITAQRNYSLNSQSYFKADSSGNFPKSVNVQETGNFSMSYLSWNTAFVKDDKVSHSNKNFEDFRSYLIVIAKRLAANNPNSHGIVDSTGFPDGYGPTSQDVIIPAFLAAYAGKKAETISTSLFPTVPMPNWRITYNGLTKIGNIKKYLRDLSLSHAYRSSYTVGSFASNILYREDIDGFQYARDALNNFRSEYEINQIAINEQFSPLISFDMSWQNSLTTKIEIKKSRNLTFSFSNNQLTEVSSSEFIIGGGYRIKDVQFVIKSGGGRSTLKSDLNLKADLSIRNNKAILRKLVENSNLISTGMRVISINISADYMINQRFNIRAFFDKQINKPFTSLPYYNSNTNAGISLRFSLAQ